MPLSHLLLALAVVFVWGTNFVVIKWGLAEFPPLLMAALRFAASSLPFLLFVPRPAVTWRHLAAFGLLIGWGQFGLLFYAMRADITPGLASLVVQTQVFFTIGLSMLLYRERVRPLQWLAFALAAVGVGVIAAHQGAVVQGEGQAANATVAGLAMILLAALCWSGGNLVARIVGRVDAVGFMVWSSLFAVPPLLILSLVVEGAPAVRRGLMGAALTGWAAVGWQAVGNTLFGYGAWTWLLARHPAATVTPAALLVPVFGMSASAWMLGEPLPAWKLGAAVLVIAGLGLNLLATRPAAPQRA